jgi:hypothetical protein
VSTHLKQVLLTAVVTAVAGLFVTEFYQTTPWLANKFMRWSVRLRYTNNPERATVREEELLGLLEDLPTLFKLPTAVVFLVRAFAYRLIDRRNRARSICITLNKTGLILVWAIVGLPFFGIAAANEGNCRLSGALRIILFRPLSLITKVRQQSSLRPLRPAAACGHTRRIITQGRTSVSVEGPDGYSPGSRYIVGR